MRPALSRAKVLARPSLIVLPSPIDRSVAANIRAGRIDLALAAWTRDYDLSAVDQCLLRETLGGAVSLKQIAVARGTEVETVRKQSKKLLKKTGDDSLPFAAIRLQADALSLA